jgi:NADPH:quinone reductase-like Zn-dependent oxidoreductase
MRAVVHDRYGTPDVLRLTEVAKPDPSASEVLVRVHAATVNRTDCGFRSGKPEIVRLFSGLLKPRRQILGSEFAGVVEAVGSSVTRFAVGDRVFGVNADRFGAHAEYLCVNEDLRQHRSRQPVSEPDPRAPDGVRRQEGQVPDPEVHRG